MMMMTTWTSKILKAVLPLAATKKNPDMQYMGRKLKMCFRLEDTGKIQWFDGQILNYDPSSGQYGVYFPSDHQTMHAS